MTHTKGPWTVVESIGGKIKICGSNWNRKDTESDKIASCPHRKDHRGLANAHLIAAAPDLLEELIVANHMLGRVKMLLLQRAVEDAIDELSVYNIEFRDGYPSVKSPAVTKAEGGIKCT